MSTQKKYKKKVETRKFYSVTVKRGKFLNKIKYFSSCFCILHHNNGLLYSWEHNFDKNILFSSDLDLQVLRHTMTRGKHCF